MPAKSRKAVRKTPVKESPGTPERKENSHADEANSPEPSSRPSSPPSSPSSRERRKSHRSPKPKKKRSFWTSSKFIFIIGTLVGVIGAGYYGHRSGAASDLTDISRQWLLSHRDFLPRSMLEEVEDMSNPSADLSDSFAVGMNLSSEGYGVDLPVILVPGVISTSLESWGLQGTAECPSKPHYRKRLWGSWYMIRTMLMDKNCWLKHLMLDEKTGLDPPDFRLRAAQGMEAADFFMTGYWLWSKIIENLSAMGYDTNTMSVAAYDWRLGYPDLENRDGFFSLLKRRIEENKNHLGKKTVISGHSMGSQVIFYFMKWVEAAGHGNGGRNWVNDHIEAFVDISGSMLGTPKATAALLSGEMKDTVQLNAMAMYGLEKFFARHERRELAMSWPGIASMLPKGGDWLWGNLTWAPDDQKEDGKLPAWGSFGKFLRFDKVKSNYSERNLTVKATTDYLLENSPEWFSNRTESFYSFGMARTRKEVQQNEKDPRKWSNPLEVALPNAPDLKVYCFYGVGKPTERAYTYADTSKDASTPLNFTIDFDGTYPVILGEGDGTVSLLTHTMCHRWKDTNSKFNPGNSEIKVVEMLHQPDNYDLRGGAKTAEHVDILGRTELNELLCRVAAGFGNEIEQKFHSNLTDYADLVDLGTN